MIPVRKTSPGVFEQIIGNPTLKSLDGKERAPLRTILAPSWSDADRARFGVYMAEPFVAPEGKACVGDAKFVRSGEKIVEQYDLQDATSKLTRPQIDRVKVAAELSEEGRITILGLTYPVMITADEIQIACVAHTPAEWAAFDDDQIAAMDGTKSARFWKKYRTLILNLAGAL